MRIAKYLLVVIVLLAAVSWLSVYAYGRFAAHARGRPSESIPPVADVTALDRVFGRMADDRPDQNGLALIAEDVGAFAARAHAARAAGRSLDLQYYYWRDDLTGGLLTREVLAAADRGVRVRILLDDINTRGDDSLLAALDSHPRIEVRLFNPAINREGALGRGAEMLLRFVTVTRRMHNKAWIADGRVAIVGGRNIGDAYFGAARDANFRDLDVLMVGTVVTSTASIFDRFWNSPVVLPVARLSDGRGEGLLRLRARLDLLAHSRQADAYLSQLEDDEAAARASADRFAFHWTAEAEIVSDPPEKVLGVGQQGWLDTAILPTIASATQTVELISPYFIPGDEGMAMLKGLTGRRVSVSVLTNSLAATDVAAVHGAYAPYRPDLLAAGVYLFELRPDGGPRRFSLFGSSSASLHTKAFTVDGIAGFVGSFNFDPRSISLNTEMGLIFRDRPLASALEREFATHTDPKHSYRLALESGRIVWTEEHGRQVGDHDPDASLWRRFVAAVTGLLPLESQL